MGLAQNCFPQFPTVWFPLQIRTKSPQSIILNIFQHHFPPDPFRWIATTQKTNMSPLFPGFPTWSLRWNPAKEVRDAGNPPRLPEGSLKPPKLGCFLQESSDFGQSWRHFFHFFLYTNGGFLKWWYPKDTPKWSFLVGKPMVVGYHCFRKPPNRSMVEVWNCKGD